MLQSMALFAALTMTPGQGAGLTLSNPRITYGELGSTRPDNKLLPGDIFFLSFDIDGIKVSEAGRVKYGMAMEVVDATGKSIFKQMPVERDDFLPLGGTRLPARRSSKYASVRRVNSSAASPPRAYPYPGRSTRYKAGAVPRRTR